MVSKKTDAANAGDASVTLTLIWDSKRYNCTISGAPFTTNTLYLCDVNNWVETTITPIAENPYFMKIKYLSSTVLQFAEIEVTDINGDTYTVNEYCISPKMTCTIDNVISAEYNSLNCDQWKSKLKYNKLALGGDTKFELLYVDLEIFIARFANKYIEGGVRPPNLIQYGITTGIKTNSFPTSFSIQWDTVFYRAGTETPDQTIKEFNWDMANEPVYCPAEFWMSIYNPYDEIIPSAVLTVGGIWVTVETNRKY